MYMQCVTSSEGAFQVLKMYCGFTLTVCPVVRSIVYVCVLYAAYMTTPCHIEMILTEKDEAVPKAEEEKKKKVSKKKLKREKMRAAMTGGD